MPQGILYYLCKISCIIDSAMMPSLKGYFASLKHAWHSFLYCFHLFKVNFMVPTLGLEGLSRIKLRKSFFHVNPSPQIVGQRNVFQVRLSFKLVAVIVTARDKHELMFENTKI